MIDIQQVKESRRVKIVLLAFTVILIVLMFPRGESIDSSVEVNSIWIKDDLIASQTFEILKEPSLVEKERLIATNKIYPIFLKNNLVQKSALESFEVNNHKLLKCLNSPLQTQDSIITCNSIELTHKSLKTFVNLNTNKFGSLNLNKALSFCRNEIKKIYNQGFLNQTFSQISKDSIAVRDGKFEIMQPKNKYFDENLLSSYLDQRILADFQGNNQIRKALKEYLLKVLKPDIIFSKENTNEAKKIASSNVLINIGIVNENERIVAKHDRITPEIKAQIDSYRIAKGSSLSTWDNILQNLGKLMHISLLFLPLTIYLFLFRRKIFEDNLKLLLIAVIILFVSFSAFLISQINVNRSLELLILVPVASMLLTIIFDSRIGFYTTVIVALIVAGIRGNDYILAATNIIAGGLAAYTVRDIKNRNQIFHSFLYILLGYTLSIFAFGLERFDSWDVMLISTAYAASNAIISPALTFGLIIFIEKIFGITTEITLFELTDFNSPLLKDLANFAPGTFAHSMTIGSMVENAALKIDANPILARVGAYYHDIGKTIKPEGFIENQLNNVNIHEKISPQHSVELIRDHVLGGIELAKKHKLPQEIIDFIPMHHGTMVIKYFYEKAKELYGDERVNEEDYRYPGPKPNTRETALLMLADACESAIRSMDDPTPKKIENYVNNLFKIRIQDGQLEESPLTFKDIHLIKESFIGILVSQHHKRIRYPKQDELEKKTTDD